MPFKDSIPSIRNWLNSNQGVLSLGIFIATIALGFFSGIFRSLRRVPRFSLSLIPGPTFACVFDTGKMHQALPVHRTAISLYLRVKNTGSSASSIDSISGGYHWRLKPFSFQWLRFGLGWYWLHEQVAALDDFQVLIGDQLKIFPFLTQQSFVLSSSTETYLDVGRVVSGVVYFEQSDSWGGCSPACDDTSVKVKVMVRDAFGRRYKSAFRIPLVSLEEARKFNPSFGKTLAKLHESPLPFDEARVPHDS